MSHSPLSSDPSPLPEETYPSPRGKSPEQLPWDPEELSQKFFFSDVSEDEEPARGRSWSDPESEEEQPGCRGVDLGEEDTGHSSTESEPTQSDLDFIDDSSPAPPPFAIPRVRALLRCAAPRKDPRKASAARAGRRTLKRRRLSFSSSSDEESEERSKKEEAASTPARRRKAEASTSR